MLGFLNIDKPPGMTSHDVVAQIRRRAKQIAGVEVKVGHAGTLDPAATGVLIVCLGGAARLSEYVMAETKRYHARVHLGVTTDSEDADGAILQTNPIDRITEMDARAALPAFIGAIAQIPPMVSAIKQGGRKLYELARAGQTVERQPRAVRIDALVLSDWQPPYFTLDVTCSAGTYIRSLARDIGAALGVGAHLAALVRTASGAFALEDAIRLDVLLAADEWERYIIDTRRALPHLPTRTVDAADTDALRHGRAIRGDGAGLMLIYDESGTLIALVECADGACKPQKVFA
jgi:tRNA pseudouridine55 synthase